MEKAIKERAPESSSAKSVPVPNQTGKSSWCMRVWPGLHMLGSGAVYETPGLPSSILFIVVESGSYGVADGRETKRDTTSLHDSQLPRVSGKGSHSLLHFQATLDACDR